MVIDGYIKKYKDIQDFVQFWAKSKYRNGRNIFV